MKTQKLSTSQAEAVRHDTGPALVLAGPGSGKTFVITSRIAYLIRERQVDPAHILVVTFSRAAANTMRQRYLRMSGKKETSVVFGTFHSIFFQILRAAYHYSVANILKEEQRGKILRDLIEGYRIEGSDRRELMESLSAEISRVKNEEINLQFFYSSITSADVFRRVYGAYQEALAAAGLIDFDDMLIYTKDLLEKRPDIRSAWQRRFTYILVDEFQDINHLQYQIIRMLAAPEDNLFVVGDDDQSIYRFRGAKPEIMLGFSKDFPDAQVIRLEENYRSTDEVIRSAGKVIRANKARYAKTITGVQGSGEPVHVARLQDVREESEYLVRQIRAAREAGTPYNRMAILTRTNGSGRYIANRLAAWQIPVDLRDMAPDLYNHWVAQDILSYIRFAVAGARRADFLQIMNRPLRYISRDCLDTQEVDFDRLCMYYEDKPWMVERILDLERDIRAIRKMRPYAAVNYIRKAIGYDDYLREYTRERSLDADELLEIAGEVQEDAAAHDSFAAWSEWVTREREARKRRKNPNSGEEKPTGFQKADRDENTCSGGGSNGSIKTSGDAITQDKTALESTGIRNEESDGGSDKCGREAAQNEGSDRRKNEKEKAGTDTGVVLSTLHSAKGLEYDIVFLPDVNEGLIPYRKALLESEIEEERRLLYVGMTRARKSLHILYVKDRFGREQKPSRFLQELTK